MNVGTEVVHSTFGTGTVVHVGDAKGADAVWIDFDRGDRKTLDPEFAAPHVRRATPRDRKTLPRPDIRCDTCGARPVAVTIAGAGSTQQFCEEHKSDYDPHA